MKIGMFATWLSKTAGGIENLCYNMFTSLQAAGNEMKAFSLDVPSEEKLAQDVYYANTDKRTVPVFTYLRDYRRERKKGEFDINIAIHWGPGLCAYIVKKLYGTPYLVYVHGKEVDYFKTPLHKFIVSVILNNAKYIMGNSNYTLGLCHWTKNKNYALIHPGVDEEMLDLQVEYTPKEKGTPIELFTISRLVRRKGIDNTIRAVRLLLDEGYDVRYKIAGGGEAREEFEQIAKEEGVENAVSFLGRISVEDKVSCIQSCDLFMMPSYEIKEEREVEGFGIVYLEANAAGKFVIAGQSGGVPDAVQEGKTGFLVDGADPEQIKAGILRYMEKPDEEKKQLAQESRRWAEEHRWELVGQRVEELL